MSDAARSAYVDAPAREAFGITTYAVAPIVLDDGEIFGTLCVLDSEEVEVTEEQRAVLVALSKLIARVYDDRRRKEQLRDALYRLQHASEDRHRLVERIAADVAEPIEAITGLTGLLVEHDVDADAQGPTIRMVHAHAQRVRVLLEGLIQAESGGVGELGEIDAAELAAELGELGRELVGPELTFEATGSGTLIAPRQCLTRLLQSLVVGATQRSESGAITLDIADVGSHVRIGIADPGRALSDAERAALLDGSRSGRLDAADLAHDDVRLPLVVARQLAASLGVELGAIDRADGGTEVTVALPASSLAATTD